MSHKSCVLHIKKPRFLSALKRKNYCNIHRKPVDVMFCTHTKKNYNSQNPNIQRYRTSINIPLFIVIRKPFIYYIAFYLHKVLMLYSAQKCDFPCKSAPSFCNFFRRSIHLNQLQCYTLFLIPVKDETRKINNIKKMQ